MSHTLTWCSEKARKVPGRGQIPGSQYPTWGTHLRETAGRAEAGSQPDVSSTTEMLRSARDGWSTGSKACRSMGVVLALALVATACTTKTVDTTTTSSMVQATTITPRPDSTQATLDPALAEPLPIDPEVRIGQLDNGLTYYLRHNDSPGGRVEFRLVINAGSVLEDADQAGTAHFLEHMMFNGTEAFPRNELTAALESFGPRFGRDINAYTSFDETVYELSLSSDDDELMTLGIDVLREWAGRATITEVDVVDERGVVLDEWRLRAQGYSGRIGDAFQRLILPGTPYEGRVPIGDAESIQATTRDLLQRFYDDWYRPDLMAVVAVGEFDLDQMEDRIVDAFGDLDSPDDPRSQSDIEYEPGDQPSALGMTDEEATSASVTVLWRLAAGKVETVGDVQASNALAMALDSLSNRLNDDALRGTAPLLGSAPRSFRYSRAIKIAGVAVEAHPEDLDQALSLLLTEVERIKEFGITEDEFDRAITRFRAASKQRNEQQGTAPDSFFAGAIVAHHLAGSHLMSPDQRFEIETGIYDRLTKADIEDALVKLVLSAPVILALGPDDDAVVPDEDRILTILDEVTNAEVTPRDSTESSIDSMMAVPDREPVATSEVDDQFGYTTLTFENGATVMIWQSDIAEQQIYFNAESFGGTSQIDIEDLPEAFLITDIIGRSGVGPADVPTIQKLLAGRLVTLFPYIDETREGLLGASATKDVEILFQLLHLYVTAPRVEDVAVTAVLDEMETLNASRADVPDILFNEATNDAYYGDDPRYFVIPSPVQLADFDVDRALEVYRERFGNVGDFVFAFVGDFDVDEIVDLASRYIATLPGDPSREGFVDHQPLPIREVQIAVVEAGSDPQGRVTMFFTNELEPDAKDRLTGRLLELIVNARLRDRIREELSVTYSPFAGVDLQRDPDPFVESFVQVTGDPEALEEISAEVLADLADLRNNGPTEIQFATGLEQLRTELDLINNPTLADAMINSYLYPDQGVVDLAERHVLIDELTAADVQSLAQLAFAPNQRIEIRLVPRP